METVAREESGYERVQQAHYRPARLIGLLLILQVAGLVGIVVFEFLRIDWLVQGNTFTVHSEQSINAVVSVLFVPPAILAFLAALSFLILARRGWLLAAISQGLCLGVCLWLYSGFAPVYVYPVMVSCIVLIFYLNSRTVRSLFRPEQVRRRRRERT